MRDILKGLFLVLAMGCTTVPVECGSNLKCLIKQARADYARTCVHQFQDAARKRPYKTILPYDDPVWQQEYCRRKAKRMVR